MKTSILTHADCDGICAGAIALTRFPDADVFFTNPVSFLDDFRNCRADRIVVSDIAMNQRDIKEILDAFGKTKASVFYFDHHPLSDKVKKELKAKISEYVNDNASSSELVYRYYQKQIPRERVWAAIYGAIGDYSQNTEFFRERIKNWDGRALGFEAATIVLGIKDPHFDTYDAKRMIVRTLANGENPSDVKGLVMAAKAVVNAEFDMYEVIKKKAVKDGDIGYIKDLGHFGFRGPSALFASTVTGTRIGLSIHTRTKCIDITARTRDYSVPLNILMLEAAEAVGGSGGGHPNASGARIPPETLREFLKEANSILRSKFPVK